MAEQARSVVGRGPHDRGGRQREAVREDFRVCARTLRAGSKSFFAASLLLPARVRRDATALYAFCRVADDAVDEARGLDAKRAALDSVRARLARAVSGAPDDAAIDRALADVLARRRVPAALLDALLEGFAWDAEG